MQNLPYLFATYAIVWLALFAYLFVVTTQVRAVRREVELLRERFDNLGPAGRAGPGAAGDPRRGERV